MAVETRIKDKPIIFSGPMVKAIMEGRKTQTRRVMNPQPNRSAVAFVRAISGVHWIERLPVDLRAVYPDTKPATFQGNSHKCPYQVGQCLWVRETWRDDDEAGIVIYRTDPPEQRYYCEPSRWKPSIFMPRAYSRISLEVTGIRVERLQEISYEDLLAEGARYMPQRASYEAELAAVKSAQEHVRHPLKPPLGDTLLTRFHCYWDALHPKKHTWADNPWVWVVSFKGVQP